MADQRLIYTEELVGANHGTKADTLNRLALIDHANDGKHIFRGCHLRLSADQAIGNAALTAVTWDTEIEDTDAFHSTVSNTSRITIPAGITAIRIGGHSVWTANATGRRYTQIKKNGVQFDGNPVDNRVASDTGDITIWSPKLIVTAGDYFELYVYQSSGGNLSVLGGAGFCWFAIEEAH